MFNSFRERQVRESVLKRETPERLYEALADMPVEQQRLKEAFGTPRFNELVDELLLGRNGEILTTAQGSALFTLLSLSGEMQLERTSTRADEATWLKP